MRRAMRLPRPVEQAELIRAKSHGNQRLHGGRYNLQSKNANSFDVFSALVSAIQNSPGRFGVFNYMTRKERELCAIKSLTATAGIAMGS
jgi:hypothetical protein